MEVMRFGRYVGRLVREVPTDYLLWCYDNVTTCPVYVVDELGSRGIITGDLWLSRQSSPSKRKHKKAKRKSRSSSR